MLLVGLIVCDEISSAGAGGEDLTEEREKMILGTLSQRR